MKGEDAGSDPAAATAAHVCNASTAARTGGKRDKGPAGPTSSASFPPEDGGMAAPRTSGPVGSPAAVLLISAKAPELAVRLRLTQAREASLGCSGGAQLHEQRVPRGGRLSPLGAGRSGNDERDEDAAAR